MFKTKAGMGTPKYMVFNEDVDVANTKDIVLAFATRDYPGSKGEIIFNDESTNPLVVFLSKDEKMSIIDELQTFIGNKKNKVWVWTVVNHWKPRILLWTLGARSNTSFQIIWSIIRCWHSF